MKLEQVAILALLAKAATDTIIEQHHVGAGIFLWLLSLALLAVWWRAAVHKGGS